MEIKRNANRAAVLVRQLARVLAQADHAPDGAEHDRCHRRPAHARRSGMISGTNVKIDVAYGRDLWPVKTDLGAVRAGAHQPLPSMPATRCRMAAPSPSVPATSKRRKSRPLAQPARPAGRATMCDGRSRRPGHRHPAGNHRQDLSSPSSRPRKSARARASASPWSTASSNRPAVISISIPKSARAPTFRILTCRAMSKTSCRRMSQAVADTALAAGCADRWRKEPRDLTGGSAVVLLVEDEEAVRRGGKRMLETRGYTVHEAGSGTEALEVMDELEWQAVDIVVSDVVMPEMDGPSLLARTAQILSRPEVHLRLRLCRGRLRPQPPRRCQIRLSCRSRSR
jgi:two-component system cell cycle sensor histidine kinase/response regulator CckA